MSRIPLLIEQEVEEITRAVEAAERGTSGEIVPVVLRQSDDYPGARWRWAIAFAWLATFLLVVLMPGLHPIWYLWAQVPALALGFAMESIPFMKRLFLSRAEMDEEARQRAVEAFHLHQLHRTRDRTGVLIFVSLLEHRIEVLADKGISDKVPQESWDAIVAAFSGRIRAGELAKGMCEAITACGALLAKEFPARADDSNELPDHPRFEG